MTKRIFFSIIFTCTALTLLSCSSPKKEPVENNVAIESLTQTISIIGKNYIENKDVCGLVDGAVAKLQNRSSTQASTGNPTNAKAKAKPVRTRNDCLKVLADNLVIANHEFSDGRFIEVTNIAIEGMMETLDPLSSYVPPESLRKNYDKDSNMGGIGVEFSNKNGPVEVLSCLEGSPAEKFGILPGDRIIMIDDVPTENMKLRDIATRLKGAKGSTVTLSVIRDELSMPKNISIVRDIIESNDIQTRLVESKYPYVKIKHFITGTTEKIENKLHDFFEKNELEGIIIDIRDNSGGLLTESIRSSDLFVKNGIIVSTNGRTNFSNMNFTSNNKTSLPDCPVIVIVNDQTASGAEIFAAAIQDHQKGLIIGTKTNGSGTVQTLFPLKNSGALRLTTAKIYRPSGEELDKNGVIPDLDTGGIQGEELIRIALSILKHASSGRHEDLLAAAEIVLKRR